MEPYDYTSQLGLGGQIPTFADSMFRGFQQHAAIQDQRMQQEANALKIKQAEAAAAAAAEQQRQLKEFSNNPNPTAQDYARIMTAMPQLSESFKRSWDILEPAQKDEHWKQTANVYAATLNGKPEVAAQLLNDRADALENSGDTAKAESVRKMADLAKSDPEYAKKMSFLSMYAQDPKKATDLATELDRQDVAPAKLREANASADKTSADAAGESAKVIGQTLGSLGSVKNLKVSQVQAAIKSMAAKGVIPKDQVDAFMSTIPTDPKELPEYLNAYKLGGMTSAEQMKYTTADANTIANNKVEMRGQNVTMRGQDLVNARAKEANAAKEDPEGMLPPETVQMMAEQYRAGDTTVMQNLGRGAQGAKNIIALRNEITKQNAAAGGNGRDLAAQNAEYFGTKAGQRAAGTKIANVEMAVQEARNLVPLALDASAQVNRSGLLPFGKAQIMFDTQTNNPLLGKFAAANNALVNTYARAISPSGVPTVADKEHARELLSTARDHASYVAVVQQMDKEMSAAQEAPQHVRKSFNNAVTGRGTTVSNPVAAPAIPSGWSVKEH